MKPFTYIASGVFVVVALAHLLRLIFGWEMTIGNWLVPMWVSWFGFIVPGILAVLVWREARALD